VGCRTLAWRQARLGKLVEKPLSDSNQKAASVLVFSCGKGLTHKHESVYLYFNFPLKGVKARKA